MSFIKEFLIEINQFPRVYVKGDQGTERYTVKDYFFYDSFIQEYGHRDTILPVSVIINKDEIPDVTTMREFINNKTPVIKRVLKEKSQSWYFDSSQIGEN